MYYIIYTCALLIALATHTTPPRICKQPKQQVPTLPLPVLSKKRSKLKTQPPKLISPPGTPKKKKRLYEDGTPCLADHLQLVDAAVAGDVDRCKALLTHFFVRFRNAQRSTLTKALEFYERDNQDTDSFASAPMLLTSVPCTTDSQECMLNALLSYFAYKPSATLERTYPIGIVNILRNLKQLIRKITGHKEHLPGVLLLVCRQRPHNRHAIVSLLLRYGASPHEYDRESGFMPLHYAAVHGDANLVGLLISYEADLNIATLKEGYTPLHLAVLHGHHDVVDLLTTYDHTSVATPDQLGNTPIHYAAGTNDTRILARLCPLTDNHIPLNTLGNTPFEYASYSNHYGACAILLGYQDVRSYKDREGNSLVFHALATKDLHLLSLLATHGVSLDTTNGEGISPLNLAISSDMADAIALLLRRGADQDKADDNNIIPRNLLSGLDNGDGIKKEQKGTSTNMAIPHFPEIQTIESPPSIDPKALLLTQADRQPKHEQGKKIELPTADSALPSITIADLGRFKSVCAPLLIMPNKQQPSTC